MIMGNGRDKYLVKTALYMALREEVLDEDTRDILKDSFDNVKIKAAMPTNIEKKRISGYMHILPQTEKERIIDFLRK